MLTDLLYPPDTGNILCGTLNFAVLHVNFPGYPPDIKILPPPPGEVPAEPTEGGIPPRRTGEVPRFARQRGIRPARGKHKHFKRNNPRAPDTMIHPPPGSRGCYALNPACLAPRAMLAETLVPDPRGRRRVIFCVTFPARIFRFPMELRSPAPRALKQ